MKQIWFFLLFSCLHTNAQEKRLYDLPMGSHSVGFKTITLYDLSRNPLYESDFDGKLTKRQNDSGRALNIHCWYPAMKNDSRMKWQDYVAELGRPAPTYAAAFRKGMSLYLHSINELREKEIDSSAILKLYGLYTNAFANAQHTQGKYPLILFPSYRSPSTITILSEYLASYGFVVASIELLGTDSNIPEISPQGIQSMTLDLLFTLNYLRTQPFVDKTKLAAVGLGISATVAFSLRAVSPEVDALISLEGGILSTSEMQMLSKSPFYDPTKFNGPALFIYAPHPSIDPKNIDALKYADKHFVYFPKMSEHYFLDYGILERHVPGILGNPPGDTEKGFSAGANYVLKFLEFALNQNQPAKKEFMRLPADTILNVSLKHVPALPSIPSVTEMKNIIARDGTKGFVSVFEKSRNAGDSLPFTQQYLVDLFSWLAFRRDTDFSNRKMVAETRVNLYPKSSRAHFSLANVYFQLKNKEKAIIHYQTSLKLLPEDRDADLTIALRERIQTVSGENLRKLEGL